jgi:hypothetical protein
MTVDIYGGKKTPMFSVSANSWTAGWSKGEIFESLDDALARVRERVEEGWQTKVTVVYQPDAA